MRVCVRFIQLIVLFEIGQSFLGPRLGLLFGMLVYFQLPKGSIVNGIAVTREAGDTEPYQLLIVCNAGVAGATVVEIFRGFGLIWVPENLVKGCHISQPVKQSALPPGTTADSVWAFPLAQSQTSQASAYHSQQRRSQQSRVSW